MNTPANVTGSFDFDCNGTVEKETAEYPRATCRFCAERSKFNLDCSVSSDTCYEAFQSANLSCQLTKGLEYTCAGPTGRAYDRGFTSLVGCGSTGNYVDCGSCKVKGAVAGGTVTDPAKVQRCH